MSQYAVPLARPAQQRRPDRRRGSSWRVPAALVLLSIVPVVAGSLRVVELATGVELMPSDPRFTAAPLPVVLHITGAMVYVLLGAFQFSAQLRRRHPGWHRRAGRVLVVAGLTVAISALWMTLLYPRKEETGDLLVVFRLLFGSAMVLSLVLGFAAIRRREIARHRAWMMRGYALGLAAGTQAFTLGIGEAVFGTGEVRHSLFHGVGWMINLAVAEWAIRRPAARRRHLPRPPAAVLGAP